MSPAEMFAALNETCDHCGRPALDCHNRPCVASMAGPFTGGPDSVEWLREQRSGG